MFHWQNETFFGRRKDGSVRILKFPQQWTFRDGWPNADGLYEGALINLTISADHWGSIVASVSHAGEEGGRWFQAMAFHNGEGSYHDLISRLINKRAELEKELAEHQQVIGNSASDMDTAREAIVRSGELEAMIEFLKSCVGNAE